MAAASGSRALHPVAEERVPLLSVGMVLFLASELMFFAALFAMYFTLRSLSAAWPPPGIEPDLVEASVFTVVLVASSATMQVAVGRIRGGDRRGMARWVGVTLALGVLFLAAQLYGYSRDGFGIASGAYGSAFYTMTGFHGLHVFAGLLLMLVVLGRAGAYSAENHAGVEVVSYYWHFVDVVWLGLFATLYLIG